MGLTQAIYREQLTGGMLGSESRDGVIGTEGDGRREGRMEGEVEGELGYREVWKRVAFVLLMDRYKGDREARKSTS